jgi:regulatory subunit for Cdc7p protein kinase
VNSSTRTLETAIHVRVSQHIEDFFSSEITHLITNQSLPPDDADKENKAMRYSNSNSVAFLRSPIKLGTR